MTEAPSLETLKQRLQDYRDPYLDTDLGTAGCVTAADREGDTLLLQLSLGFFCGKNHQEQLQQEITQRLVGVDSLQSVSVVIHSQVHSHAVQKNTERIHGIKNIIAIASGKGGVGKSTTAANLALALQADGARVGLLDADIYGPSQTQMLALKEGPSRGDGKRMKPPTGHGLQAMSIGLFIDVETPMIWRGPMVTQALQQLFRETLWDNLDYLIVDLPPGTGDTQLTLAQKIPVSSAIIITTPQEIALLDARRGLKMFEQTEIPVLGLIENMALYQCSACGHEEAIFGQGGGERLCQEANIPLLGSLPLERLIGTHSDNGTPTVIAAPESATALKYREIARRTAARLSLRPRDPRGRFPAIVIR